MKSFKNLLTAPVLVLGGAWVALNGQGCAVTATRPVQEMSDTTAAIRAAKEVQADSLAPELYRQANEWFFKARQEYKLKNFKMAQEYTIKARRFAELAEFESVRNGGNRSSIAIEAPAPPPASPGDPSAEIPAPESTGMLLDTYEEKQKEAAQPPALPVPQVAPIPSPT